MPTAPTAAPARRQASRRKVVLTAWAVAMSSASLLVLGPWGLLPFGLSLALSTDSRDGAAERVVGISRRNLELAAAVTASFAAYWLLYLDLSASALVLLGGAVIALPLALEDSAAGPVRAAALAVTKRSLVLSLWGLVAFVVLLRQGGLWPAALATVAVVLPLALASARALAARRGQVELGLLRHPLRRALRWHLLQTVNVWLACALLGLVLAAGGAHHVRIMLSLSTGQFDVLMGVFGTGLVLLAALAVVPRRRVYVATNVVVALLAGFLAVQLTHASGAPAGATVLDSPLAGTWFVADGGRGVLLNGHSADKGHAIDFMRLGPDGRTHAGGDGAPLAAYPGFGMPVLAPADGRVVEVTDGHADNRPGLSTDHANHLVIDIGGGRFVSMAQLEQGSSTVRTGDAVRRGQQLAAVGNNGHSSQPHLHLQVQDSAAGMDADRTYPMVFRNVRITRGGPWPWGDSGEVRSGDLVEATDR